MRSSSAVREPREKNGGQREATIARVLYGFPAMSKSLPTLIRLHVVGAVTLCTVVHEDLILLYVVYEDLNVYSSFKNPGNSL